MVGLDGQQASDNPTFLGAELARVPRRIQLRLPHLGRNISQFTHSLSHRLLALRWHLSQHRCRPAYLLARVGREPFHVLHALERTLPLFGRHLVELLQAVGQPLLLLGRQTAESLLLAKPLNLLLGGEAAVPLHPLVQVLLSGRMILIVLPSGRVGLPTRLRRSSRRRSRIMRSRRWRSRMRMLAESHSTQQQHHGERTKTAMSQESDGKQPGKSLGKAWQPTRASFSSAVNPLVSLSDCHHFP
jgi:hypothetical protein